MSVLRQVLVQVGVLGFGLVVAVPLLFESDVARADERLANAVERVDLRRAATRHYRKPDGTMVAVTSAVSTHFRTGGGAWLPIEPTLALAGDGTAERQGSSVRLRSDESGLHLTDAQGRGLVWLLPRKAEVHSDGAVAEIGGTQWHYTLTAAGIKAEARIDKPRGAQTYRFPFDLAGDPGRVEIDAGGNAVLRGILHVPRAFVFGADGKTYHASAWRLATINSATQPVLEFDFDDSELAAEAFPYVLDPTTYTAADTVGGGITGTSGVYATARATSNGVAPGAGTMTVGQSLSGSSYTVARGFLSFPTGSIPADATIEEVRLEMRATDANVDTDFNVEVRQFAWSAPLADTREANYDGCLAAALDGVWSSTANLDPNDPIALSEALDPTWVAKGGYGETRYCLLSSRDAAGLAPSGDEAIELAADDDPNDYPRLIITYAPPPHIAYFDGAELGSSGTGIDLSLGECFGYSQTACASGTTCRWHATGARSGDLGFEFDAGTSGNQVPALRGSVGSQSCTATAGGPCWLQTCFNVPTTLTLPTSTAAPIAQYLSSTTSDPEIGLREGTGNSVEVHGSWGATSFASTGLAKGTWHCAVLGFQHASHTSVSDGQLQLWVNREQVGSSAAVANAFGGGSEIRYGILGALGDANEKLYLDDIVFVDAKHGVSARPGDWRIELGAAPTQSAGGGWSSYNANCSSFHGCTDERPFSDANVTLAKSKPAGEWAAVRNPSYGFASLGGDESVVAVAAQACVSEQPSAQDPDYLLLLRGDDSGSDSFCKGEVYIANHADYRLKTLVSTKAATANCNDDLSVSAVEDTWTGIERGRLANSYARVSTLWLSRIAEVADPPPTPTVTATPTASSTPTATYTPTPIPSPTPTATDTPTATTTPTPSLTATPTSTSTPTPPPTPEEIDSAPDPAGPPTAASPAVIAPYRESIVRGKVTGVNGSPLAGVSVSVLNQPDYGSALTRDSGFFDIVVNGGGTLTLDYAKQGYIPVQRKVDAPWRDSARPPDVVMIPYDSAATQIDLSETEEFQVHRGNAVTDDDGTRRATVLFPPNLAAEMVTANGTQSLTTMTVRATEYTVGDAGLERMPADLPPASAYTYAVELSVDEAVAAGATSVEFDRPAIYYVENFLGFPVGGVVPVGYYDRQCGCWIPSDNGRIIRILLIDENGLAELDSDGVSENDPDNGIEIGVTEDERRKLGDLYTANQELWRVQLGHFSPWDLNWPEECEDGSDCEEPTETPTPTPTPTKTCEKDGSIVCVQPQALGERLPVVGTGFALNYRSDRVPGRVASRTVDIPLSGSTLPAGLVGIELRVDIAGRRFRQSFDPVENLSTRFVWDGLDAYGDPVPRMQAARIRVGYVYEFNYQQPAPGTRAFGAVSGVGFPDAVPARREDAAVTEYVVNLNGWDQRLQGLGGWSLDVHHAYDSAGTTLYLGDGTRREAAKQRDRIIRTVAGNGAFVSTGIGGVEFVSSGDGGPAADATLGFVGAIEVGPDGSVYFVEDGEIVRRIDPEGVITTVAGGGAVSPGDGLPATMVDLEAVHGIAVGPDGSLYIVDGDGFLGGRVRRVDAEGV